MDALAFTSAIAVVCVAIFVVACIYLGFVGIFDRGVLLYLLPLMSSGIWTGGPFPELDCQPLLLCSCFASARTSTAPRS